ncbi:hypothetical protein Sango_0719200 [Sesamum angolense]|uniref:SWIM-type domain-containing protein n=1 Tax=Sesamum angolense TaxID=2727404 RepID=A0AAE2BZI9_9LAMI|nr:hypothetical protein Sango_0719200 [Sesamum angolense]
MQENRDRSNTKWKEKLCPKIQQILQKHASKVADCMPIKADDLHYQVSCFDGSQHCVDLGAKSCSCRKWQLSGIPCKHACCAIYHQKQDPIDYVADCYSVDTYRKVYEPAIQPMSHEGLWSESLIIPPLPPNFRGPGHVENLATIQPNAQKGKEKQEVLWIREQAKKQLRARVHNILTFSHLCTLKLSQHLKHASHNKTVSQPPAVPVYKAGPSMYEQLSMSNKHDLTIKGANQSTSTYDWPTEDSSFSSVSRAQSGTIKPIITEGGQKYLDLSQFSSSDAH